MNDSEIKNINNKIKPVSDGRINRFGERLKIAMNGQKNVTFAKQCNMSERVIRDYLSGRTYPSLDRLADIAKASGRTIEWLATGYDINASQSDNIITITELTKVNDPIQFTLSKDWLSNVGLIDKQLALICVKGDNMSPTLHHNDIALIEIKSNWDHLSDGIYVIKASDNKYIIRRIQFDISKNGYHVKSDNQAYTPEFIIKANGIDIVGKIERILSNKLTCYL